MKVIGILLGLVVLVVAGVFGYLFFFAGDVIERGIEELGPEYLGTSVTVSAVDMDFVAGRGSISGLNIGNPTGFDGPYAMQLGTVSTTVDLENSTADLIVIKDITVKGASLAAVANGQKTNFQQLMDNIESAVGAASDSDASTSADSSDSPKFIVDRFSFTEADVSLVSDILGDKQLEIPPIRLTDIGRKTDGATAAEVAQQLMEPVTAAITRAVVSEGLDLEGVESRLMDKVRDKVPGVDKLKDLF
ncbi:MAG: hypothetical protein ACI9ON_004085 [Limisphaerales bacterium]|jgi:hypothetical protein